jgi:Family of unknown function (DUF6318)
MVSTMNRSRALIRGSAGCLLLALTSCSPDSGPAPAPPTAASTTTSAAPSPSTTPPVLPAAAKQPTRPGAEAFFRYFIDVYDYTFDSQDTTLLRQISDTDCKFCKNSVADVEATKANRHHTVGGESTSTVVVAAPGEPEEGILVNAIIHQESSTVVDSSGKILERDPTHPNVRMDAAVRWKNGAWQMRGIYVYPQSTK